MDRGLVGCVFAIVVLLGAGAAVAADPPATAKGPSLVDWRWRIAKESEALTIKDPALGELSYRLFKPKNIPAGQKLPLVLCLHGAGERGTDNQKQLGGMPAFLYVTRPQWQATNPCIALAPQCPDKAQWVDTPWGKGSYSLDKVKISAQMQLVVKLLDQVEKDLPVDTDREYVTGLSMGGFGTWDLLERFPKRFAAAIPVCGAGDPSKAELIKDIPIKAFHGGADNIVPVTGTRDMAAALKKVEGKIEYTEFPGVDHLSWDKAFGTEGLWEWLFKQKR